LATAQENQRNCTVRAALILNQNWPVLNLAGPFMTRSAEPNALGVREGRLAEQCRRRRTPALARRLRPTCRRRSPARSAAARAAPPLARAGTRNRSKSGRRPCPARLGRWPPTADRQVRLYTPTRLYKSQHVHLQAHSSSPNTTSSPPNSSRALTRYFIR
jgi:hypothetical protein